MVSIVKEGFNMKKQSSEVYEQEKLRVIMSLIINGGNAKNYAFEAINAAKIGEFTEVSDKLKAADEALLKAHNAQSKMLACEASGLVQDMNILMVHAQDHLMNAITFKDLASELVAVYHVLNEKNKLISYKIV